tara:strand:- start:7975 stop:8103 length:129 start_codon:yes stop_codon:yes gene_type:complete
MPITDDNSQEQKNEQQLIGVLVIVAIVGGLLWLVLKVSRKKK